MKRIVLVVLAVSVLLGVGGFAAGMAIGARNPTKQLAEARKSIDELESDLSKGRDRVKDLKRELEAAKADAADHARELTKALKRIAGLERDRKAAERAATPVPGTTNVAERVITLDGKDGGDIIAQQAKQAKKFRLCITPEGTRKAQPDWKKGFYYIALKAEIPILLYGLDFAERRIVCTKTIIPDGNIDAQMQEIKEYYSDFKGLHPEQFVNS